MYIYKRKLKNDTVYYLCKSYCDPNTGKNSSKIVERIGTEKELKSKTNDLKTWLKKYAKEKTTQEKENNQVYNISFNSGKRLSRKDNHRYNAGYLVLQKICYKLGIDKICEEIAKEAKYKGDLTKITLALIYNQILFTEIPTSFHAYNRQTVEDLQVTDKELNKAIAILADYSTLFQCLLSANARKILKYDCSLIFNECVNYCYGINQYSKKNKRDIKASMNVAQLDLFTDANGIPLAYLNNSSGGDMDEMKNRIISALEYWQPDSQIISFNDSLPSKFLEEIDERGIECKTIKNVRIKMLKPHLKDWIVDSRGWMAWKHDKIYDLREVYNAIYSKATSKKKKGKLDNIIFYKVFNIEKEKKMKLIAGFNFMGQREDMQIRNDRYEQIKQILDKRMTGKYKDDPEAFEAFAKKFKRFLDKNVTKETFENNYVYDFDSEIIKQEAIYDGFCACLCDVDIKDPASVMYHRFSSWLVDYIFKNMKQEFSSIPESLPKEKSINAHLLISFVSLMITKILQKLLKDNFSLKFARDAMLDFDFVKVSGLGWIPAYVPNEITDFLDNLCDIKTDYEFISQKDMRRMIKATKNKVFKL